jgi:predicted HTH transcriptional regulator
VASPWARIEIIPQGDSLPKLTWLQDTLVKLGIQGFRPLTAAEESLYEMWPRERVVNFLTQFHTAQRVDDTDTLAFKKFFCMLMSHNFVYQELRSRHEVFYHWLGCKHDDSHDIPEPPLEID